MSETKVNQIVDLLENATTLEVVRDFLKSRAAHYSASSWDDLRDKRIKPALNDGLISFNDLVDLLRDSEEHGRQHVFLYACSKETATDLLEPSRVMTVAEDLDISHLFGEPLILDKPEKPVISDIRFEDDGTLTCKVIERRVSTELLSEDLEGDYLTKTYRRVEQRAVNLVRLHPDGVMEIRIGTH